MNLMDIRKKDWHPDALKATAPDLQKQTAAARRVRTSHRPGQRLFRPEIRPQSRSARHRLDRRQSGQRHRPRPHPARPGRHQPRHQRHVFRLDEEMPDRCARRRPRVRLARGRLHDVDLFQERLARPRKNPRRLMASRTGKNSANCSPRPRRPATSGGILLPWFEAEIVPRVNRPGIHRFDLDEKDAAANCRAIFEAQMMSMRLHSQWMKVAPEKIFATGGASKDTPTFAGDGRRDELPRRAHRGFQERGARRRVAGGARLARPGRGKSRSGKRSSPVSPTRFRTAKSARTRRQKGSTTS